MRHRVGYLLTLSFFVLFFFCAAAAEDRGANAGIDFIITNTDRDYAELIQNKVPEPFVAGSIQIVADICIHDNDIRYLLDFAEGSSVDAEKFTKSVYYLFLKNKFKSIEVFVGPMQNDARSVALKFTSLWTLAKLKIKGFMVGKEMYRQSYLMDPGDVFDEQKHYESLKRIKEQFRQAGYFNAMIEDVVERNEKDKTVKVSLRLSPGPHFTIDVATCRFITDETMTDEVQKVQTKVREQLTKRVHNKKYNKNLLNREMASIKKLLIKKGFNYVNVQLTETIDKESETVQTAIDIELKKGKELIFFGNRQFSSDQLLNALLSFGHSVYSIPPSLLAQELINTYHEKGFWNVSVTARAEDDRLFFIINEGTCAHIKKIVINGMHYFDPSKIIDKYFDAIVSSNSFNNTALKNATSELIDLYSKNGFFDAKITHQDIVALDEKSECLLELTVAEGERYVVNNIIIDQFPELAGECPGGLGVPCTFTLLESQKKWLQERLRAKGFADALITLELIREKAAVAVSWHIELKRLQAQFGKTVVTGNSHLPADYLVRELMYKPGEPFNINRVRQSLKKIRSLDLFDSVSLNPDPLCQLPEKPMILHVEPSDTFEVRLRCGIGLQELTRPVRLSTLTYKCGGTFIAKNPFNCADKISVHAELSRAYNDIMMKYERPWLFDTECNFFLQGYSSSYKQPGFFRVKEGLYEVWHQGFLMGMSREFEHASGAITAGVEWEKTAIRKEYVCACDSIIRALAIAPCFINNSFPFVFIEPSIIADFTDQRMNPSRGSFTIASVKCIVPFTHDCTKFSSLKLLIDQSFYHSFGFAIFALRARLGYIVGIPLEYVQLIDRFYVGGAHSIRSYYPDCTPPLGTFCDPCGHNQYVPQGGKLMVQGTLEARIPFKNGISGILFQDIGTLSDNPMSVVKGWKLLTATGFGVSYDTPIGPLRFDIGWNWARQCEIDSRYAWYIALGNAF